MAEYPASASRPALPNPKPTQLRYEQRQHHESSSIATLDKAIIALGYASLAGYLYHSARKFSPWELFGLTAGSAAVGYGLFDLGHREGWEQGRELRLPLSLAGSRAGSRVGSRAGSRAGSRRSSFAAEEEDDSWKGPFLGLKYEELPREQKIEYLQLEADYIRGKQEDEEVECGKAYVEKERAYEKYERHGGYGGTDWKRYVNADKTCKDVYRGFEKGVKRLVAIEAELESLGVENPSAAA